MRTWSTVFSEFLISYKSRKTGTIFYQCTCLEHHRFPNDLFLLTFLLLFNKTPVWFADEDSCSRKSSLWNVAFFVQPHHSQVLYSKEHKHAYHISIVCAKFFFTVTISSVLTSADLTSFICSKNPLLSSSPLLRIGVVKRNNRLALQVPHSGASPFKAWSLDQ